MSETPDGSTTIDFEEHRTSSSPGSRRERVTGLAAVAVIAAFFIFCITESVSAGVGRLSGPGSGFWPLVVAVAGLLCSIAVLLMPSTRFRSAGGGSLPNLLLGCLSLAAFPFVYYYLGLPLTSFILSMILLKVIGREGWVLSGIVSAALAGGTYWVFVVLLRVPM